MTTGVITLTHEQRLRDAVEASVLHKVSGFPVVDAQGALIGLISEHALLNAARTPALLDEPISKHMTSNVMAADESDDVLDIVERFQAFRIRRMPVLRQGKLVGVISRRDILKHLAGKNPSAVVATREFRVAIVDDDRAIGAILSKLAQRTLPGLASLEVFERGIKAVEWAQANPCDLMLTDLNMPEMSGLDVLAQVRKHDPWTQVIMITGQCELQQVAMAIRRGATNYIVKPINKVDVEDQLRRSYETCIRWRNVLQQALAASTPAPAQNATPTATPIGAAN